MPEYSGNVTSAAQHKAQQADLCPCCNTKGRIASNLLGLQATRAGFAQGKREENRTYCQHLLFWRSKTILQLAKLCITQCLTTHGLMLQHQTPICWNAGKRLAGDKPLAQQPVPESCFYRPKAPGYSSLLPFWTLCDFKCYLSSFTCHFPAHPPSILQQFFKPYAAKPSTSTTSSWCKHKRC